MLWICSGIMVVGAKVEWTTLKRSQLGSALVEMLGQGVCADKALLLFLYLPCLVIVKEHCKRKL